MDTDNCDKLAEGGKVEVRFKLGVGCVSNAVTNGDVCMESPEARS